MAERVGAPPAELRLLRRGWGAAGTAYGRLLAVRPLYVLGALVLVQWAVVLAWALTVRHNAWLYYQGGDETYYYSSAWSLAHGHIPQSPIGYGWSLVLTPLAAVAGTNILGALPAIVVFQALVLLPLGLLGIYGIGERIAGRTLGYLAAAGWVVAPFLATLGFVHRYHPQWVEQFLPQAFGFTGLSDFVSMIVVVGAAYVFLRALDADALTEAALAGLLTGFAIAIKPANVLFVAGPVLAVLVARRWRVALVYGVAMLPAVLALALWKEKGLGHLPLFSSTGPTRVAAGSALPVAAVPSYLHLNWSNLGANLAQIREFFWSMRLVEWLPIAGLVAVARASLTKAAFLGGWLAAFVFVKGTSGNTGVQNATFWRLLMPGWPAYLLLAAALPLLVPGVARALHRQVATVRPIARRSAPLVAAAVLTGAVPLVAMAALPAAHGRAVVDDYDFNTLIPVADFGLRAKVDGRTVSLAWSRQSGAGVSEFYRLYRSAPAGQSPILGLTDWTDGIACLPKAGASKCRVLMQLLEPTRTTTAADRPGPGTWTYRVALFANWVDDPAKGDALLLSTPIRVTIPR
jgi:hypothetical protein